jgi:Tol biopolymer transport system component
MVANLGLVATSTAAVFALWSLAATANPASRVVAASTPAGRLVFSQDTPLGTPNDYEETIFVARDNGTSIRQLTIPTFYSHTPRWSPDGSKIAYIGDPTGLGDIGLLLVDKDGSNERALCVDTCMGSPAWSPDGREIAVGLMDGGIGIISLHGGRASPIPLANGPQLESLDWSPDGKQFVFDDLHEHIYVVNRDGRGQRLIASAGYRPRWSPDGHSILFMRFRSPTAGIYVVNRTGGHPRLIQRFAPHSGEDSASWSSNGSEIAFIRLDRIHILELASKQQRQFTLPSSVCGKPESCGDVDWQSGS